MSADRRAMVFDLSGHVHLATYLRFLLERWHERPEPPPLDLVVSGRFMDDHPAVVALAENTGGRVRWWPVDPRERGRFAPPGARGPLDAEWGLVAEYAARTGAAMTLLPHLDGFLPQLALGVPPVTPVAGIWLAPTFHYPELGLDRGAADPNRLVRQRFLLARALRHPQLAVAWTLDPLAPGAARQLLSGDPAALRLEYLPDPVGPNPAGPAEVAALRAELGLGVQRRVVLLFGNHAARKGPHLVLGALAGDRSLAAEVSVLVAGPTHPPFVRPLAEAIAAARAAGVDVIVEDGYVADDRAAAMFRLADVVAATYPEHPGMSGITLLAAAARTPVLAGRYGLMARFVEERGLGRCVDPDDPAAIRDGLRALLVEGRTSPDRSDGVLTAHRPDRFSDRLLAELAGERAQGAIR